MTIRLLLAACTPSCCLFHQLLEHRPERVRRFNLRLCRLKWCPHEFAYPLRYTFHGWPPVGTM